MQSTARFNATRRRLDARQEEAQHDAPGKGKRGVVMAKGKSTQRKEIKKPKKAAVKQSVTGSKKA